MTIRSWRPLRHFAVLLLAIAALVSPDLEGQGRRGRASVMVDGREAVDGEVLVRFRNANADFEQARAEDEVEADEVEPVGRRGTRRMRARRLGTHEMIARLRANPDVEFVEPNYIIRIAATPNDPSFGNLWGLFNVGQNFGGVGIAGSDIDATLAWDVSTGARANVVGIVDTGIDYNHPDLAANIWTAPAPFSVTVGGLLINCAAGTHGFNAITNTCNPMDDNNHGTHVAGTIGAVGNNGVGVAGVNWTASMMGLKFLGSSGSGTTANAIKAIEFAVQAKAVLGTGVANVRVLSNSWGGGGFSQSLLDEINRTNTFDMLFVAAAGNSALNIDAAPEYPASYSAPNIIAVAATDNRDQRASFSNYGAATVHLGAPGVAILSTTITNGYAAFNGTSMATPHVSGAAALLMSTCTFTTASLKAAILAAVDPIPSLTGVTITGGRLNVNNAIRVCPPISNPVPTLASINPTSVYAGTTPIPTLTLTGSGFVPSSDVRVDGVSRATVFTNNTTLTVTLAAGDLAGVGTRAITVVNPAPGGGTSGSVTLTVLTPPTLTPAAVLVATGGTMSFTVANGPGNVRDWIGLFCPSTNADAVYVDWKYLNDAKTAPASGLSNATVTFAAPAAAGTVCNARFFINDGFTKLTTSATVTVANPVPTLTTLTPNAVIVGSTTSVTVTGTNFMPGSLVQVNGVARATTFVSATQVSASIASAEVAAASANPPITVLNPAPGGGASNALTLTVNASPATLIPAVTTVPGGGTATFALASGPGSALDWVGWFCPTTAADNAYLDWKYLTNSRTAPTAGMTAATITFTTPTSGAANCNARFFVSNGFIRLVTSATITIANPAPTLTSLAPSSVPAGNAAAITLTGTNFAPASVATVNGAARTTTFVSATQLTVAVPAGDVAAPGANPAIAVVNPAPGGGTSNSLTLTVSAGPTLTPANGNAPPASTISLTVANGPSNPTDWVGWYCPATDADAAYLDWKYLNNTRTAPIFGTTSGTVTFVVRAGGGGACEARLFASNGFTKLASASVTAIDFNWITLTLNPTAVAASGTFTVNAILGSPIATSTRDWVGLFCPTTNGDMAYVDWKYMNNTKTAPGVAWSSPAALTFTAPTAVGTKCEARLFRDNGFDKIMTSWPATVAAPTLTANSLAAFRALPLTVTVAVGPANVRDWVGLYCPATNGDFVFTEWQYLNGTRVAPGAGLSAATLTFTAPPTTGTCNFRLFANDGFMRLAISETVTVQ